MFYIGLYGKQKPMVTFSFFPKKKNSDKKLTIQFIIMISLFPVYY